MLKRLKTLLVTLALCVGTVWAGDVEDADAALVRKDYVTALTKYKSAVLKKDAYAQAQVGNMYNEGLGVVQDYAEAVRWYKLAAAQGNINAQYNLASMYFSGKGAVQDYVRAHMWSNLASVSSEENKKKRDAIASFMTGQQIAEAQKLARECQARNFKNCD